MRLNAFLCFFFLPFALAAQTVLGTYSLKNKPTDFAYKVSRPQKPVKLLFQNDSEYEVLCFDSSLATSKSFVYKQVEKNNRFVNSLETDSLLSLYFINIKTGYFYALTTRFSDSSFAWKELFREQDKEHFLKAVPFQNTLCVLSVNEANNDMIIKKFNHTRLVSTDTFQIEFPLFMSALKSNLNMLNQEPFSDIGITYVDYEIEQDISDIYTDRKLYVRDDKLIMTFDQLNTSHLVIIDMAKNKSYYKKFSFKLELETSASTTKGNSFLYKDYFFRVTSNGHQLNLAIIDFRNFKLIRNHNIYDDQPIEIKNGPLIFEESTNGSVPSLEAIKTPEKFFKVVRGANLGVTARQMPIGTYELIVGSHMAEVYQSPALSAPMGMGFGMAGIGFGMGASVMDPYYYPYGMGTRSYNVTIQKAYFHTVLTDKEFAHVPLALQPSYSDRKKAYWKRHVRMSKMPEIEVEYRWKNKMHYGYWDKKMSKFMLLEFEP